jgi:hypothetical protein
MEELYRRYSLSLDVHLIGGQEELSASVPLMEDIVRGIVRLWQNLPRESHTRQHQSFTLTSVRYNARISSEKEDATGGV